MEANRFEISESSSDSSEEADDTLALSKKRKKKQTTAAAARADKTEQSADAPSSDKEGLIESSKTLWQRLVGESPDESTAAKKPKAEVAIDTEAIQSSEAEENVPLETLTEEERLLVIQEYIEIRQQELAAEAAREELRPEEADAVAANQEFLRTLEEQLHREAPVEQAATVAYESTVHQTTAEAIDSEPVEVPTQPPVSESSSVPLMEQLSSDRVVPLRSAPFPPPRAERPAAPEVQPVRPAGSALLAGGVIGYLVGRRRGRIKTERRLAPVQQKLEQAVAEAQAVVMQKEATIRTLARERQIVLPARKPEAKPRGSEPTQRREQLGVLTLQAIEQAPTTLAAPAKSEAAPQSKPPLPVEAMNRAELLKASSEIVVGATTLRQVYETKLISERALRRLVHEHRRGGDVRRILREEILVKELSYERDPHLRDRPLTSDTGGVRAQTATTATVALPVADTTVPTAQKATARAAASPQSPRRKQPAASPALVAANAIAAVILAVLVVVLVMTRLMHH